MPTLFGNVALRPLLRDEVPDAFEMEDQVKRQAAHRLGCSTDQVTAEILLMAPDIAEARAYQAWYMSLPRLMQDTAVPVTILPAHLYATRADFPDTRAGIQAAVCAFRRDFRNLGRPSIVCWAAH